MQPFTKDEDSAARGESLRPYAVAGAMSREWQHAYDLGVAQSQMVNSKMRFGSMLSSLSLSVCLLAGFRVAVAQGAPHPDVIESLTKEAHSVEFHLTNGTLRIGLCSGNVARVTYFTSAKAPDLANPFVVPGACAGVPYEVQETPKTVDILTKDLDVEVVRYSGAVHFKSTAGESLLAETDWPFPRSLKPVDTDGEPTHRASTWFSIAPKERIYGLGQHQTGVLNERTLQFALSQDNTNISIPFWLSSKGYGVFWNNGSVTDFNNRFQPVIAMQSSVADAVDYFFLYGPNFDRIIQGYRQLTGPAPLMPRWAYGYWQSRLAYSSQKELLGIASRYRDLHIPLDNIVLDEGWETELGSRVFTSDFPDPRAMVEQLHQEHVRLMVSVWPIFAPPSATFDQMQQHNFFVTGGVNRLPAYFPGSQVYDAFNPAARQLYWQQIRTSLFDIGVDAFWMDSTEPSDFFGEERGPLLAGAKTALGNGSKYANLYPLMTTESVYQGQRAATDQKRVFILTRSGFAGMQRHGAAAWSGDIAPNFLTLKREIPAGLNYSMTGLPYWTTDIGGFNGGDPSDPAYQEVFVRWFQYGAFCPIFRVHGSRPTNELWSYGEQAQQILTEYDKLRYRLMPYIYSIAGRTTFDGYTPMRALAFDFRTDARALDITDEFLFGPSILVAPVTDAGAKSREVYLPAGVSWYDFWTGQREQGGDSIDRQTPLATMPLYVRGGTILPMGPEEEYTGEHPDAPLEVRIYPGADADFSLYDDDGTSYGYEKGQSTRVRLHWDDTSRTVSIATREGSFATMQPQRVFRFVLVGPSQGTGESPSTAGQSVTYRGEALQVHLE